MELVSSTSYLKAINSIVSEYNCIIKKEDTYYPRSEKEPSEKTIVTFCRNSGLDKESTFDFNQFEHWWPKHPAKAPTWDLISTCKIGNQKGILLVEAKAHEKELDYKGKKLQGDANEQSKKNHKDIGKRIKETRRSFESGLRKYIKIGIESHYQLCNRVASAAKLASCGIPVILLYLGFTGDNGIPESSRPFVSDVHWQRAMGAYMYGVLPLNIIGKKIGMNNSNSSMTMLVKSLPIKSKTEK